MGTKMFNRRQSQPGKRSATEAALARTAWWAAMFFSTVVMAQAATPVSFSREIAPILLQKCQACHSPEKTKGGYQLHTFEAVRKAGSSDEPAITAGSPQKSKLYALLTTKDADERMPQKDDPLPAAQIALIERWILEGAKFDGGDPKALLSTLIPRRANPNPPEKYARPVPVLALAFSPDGKELAASGYHEVTLWEPGTGRLVRRFRDVPQRTQAIAYSPDGKWLALAGGDSGKTGEVKLFDTRTGNMAKLLGTTADLIFAVAFSPDGTKIASGGADNAIRIYDVATGKQELLIEQHADWVLGLAYSPDGKLLASASRDKSARLYDTKTGELEKSYLGHEEPVFSVAFSNDGKQVISSGRDKRIHIWSATDFRPESAKKKEDRGVSQRISGFDGDVLKVLAGGAMIFAAAADGTVKGYEPESRKVLRTFAGNRDAVYALAYDPINKRLASGSYDGQVQVWNLVNENETSSFVAAPGYETVKIAR